MKESYLITSSPQFHSPLSTPKVMWTVAACLVPAWIWGIYVFGLQALGVTLGALFSALLAECALAWWLSRRITIQDGSAFVTGLLIGFNMPPTIPLHIVMVSSFFAIIVVKWSFGGLGANWMNPALAGRVFVFFSWPIEMTTWVTPQGADAMTTATPLGALKTALGTGAGGGGPLEVLQNVGFPTNYMDLFLGRMPGSLGEVSAFLLLAGGLVLVLLKIAHWGIVVSYLGSFSLLVWVFGGLRYGQGLWGGDVLFHLFSGGLMLGAFFMATDMASSPLTIRGMVVYGVGCGFLTYLLRFFGSVPEGVSLAIILMNIFVPLIDRIFEPERFGLVKKEKRG